MQEYLLKTKPNRGLVGIVSQVHPFYDVLDDMLRVANHLFSCHVEWIIIVPLVNSSLSRAPRVLVHMAAHLVSRLYPVDLHRFPLLAVDAPDDIGIGTFARHIALEEHLGLSKGAIEAVEGAVGEKVKLGLVFIQIVLCLRDEEGNHGLVLILTLVKS